MGTSNNESLENVSSSNIMLNFEVDDFELVCLDVEINDCHNMEDKIKHVSTHLRSFTDVDLCLEYLISNWFYRIFLIVSDRFASSILSQAEKIDYIISVFIFCKNLISKDIKITSYKKLRGIFYEKDSLILNVVEDTFTKTSIFSINNVFQCVNESQKSFLDLNDTCMISTLADVNNAARPYYEDHLISSNKQQMLRECRLFYRDNKEMMKQIEEFSQEYNPTEAIEWYTKNSFLYKLINAALRTQSTEIIDKFRFFIKNFEESLDLFFAKQTFNQWSSPFLSNNKLLFVYRGQIIPHSDVIRLQSLIGQHIILSQYISTTKDILVAQMFAGAGEHSPQFESVIYKIDMSVLYEYYIDKSDPSIYYYDISYISQYREEEEVLLRIGTTFKVESVEKLSDNRWNVILRLEKVDDYRYKNTINRTPIEIVQSFFNKASQKQKIDVQNIINERLSSNIILVMSVFIRLGHLVKHHPREQLQYYQSALSLIPSNESTLLEVGYWAIRMRCISTVNDWTSIPLNIYRQTVLHIHGDFKQKLHQELARIDEARGDFYSAKIHYDELLKCTDDHLQRRIIFDDIKRIDNKVNELKPVLPPGEVAYWYLYVSVLTITERPLIDHHCKIFHQSIDNLHLSEDFSFTDLLLLPHIDLNEHIQLMNNSSNNIKFDSIDCSVKHVFIVSLTDKPFTLMIEKNLTIGQLKEMIRCCFDIPYPEKYDFRLIHLGITLIDEQKSLDHYQINDQSVIYLIHGPRIQHKPINGYEQRLHESTGLTLNDILRTFAAEERRLERIMAKQQRDSEKIFNTLQNYRNQTINAETVNSAFRQSFQETLVSSQCDDDEDADPAHLLDMPDYLADEYIQNSGPRPSMNRVFQLFLCSFPPHANIEENNNFQHHNQNDDENGLNQIEQETDGNASIIDQSLFLPNCFPS